MSAVELPVPHPVFKDRHGEPWYRWKDTLVTPGVADLYSERKRLTSAELAAEVWKQEACVTTVEASGGTPIRTLAALNTLTRFATLPHYDEAPR